MRWPQDNPHLLHDIALLFLQSRDGGGLVGQKQQCSILRFFVLENHLVLMLHLWRVVFHHQHIRKMQTLRTTNEVYHTLVVFLVESFQFSCRKYITLISKS